MVPHIKRLLWQGSPNIVVYAILTVMVPNRVQAGGYAPRLAQLELTDMICMHIDGLDGSLFSFRSQA